MKTNPITFAARAKGSFALLKRARNIARRYGITPAKIDRALCQFVQTLQDFDCTASFPLTAVALRRNRNTIARYLNQNIEFVVHGYTHIDYSQLEQERVLLHLQRARKIFTDANIRVAGFRSPYLRREPHLYAAIEAAGFSYVSNQPIMWDVLARTLPLSTHASYKRAIDFYEPWSADQRLSLPQLYNQLVEIPVSLPDDEMLLDRLDGETDGSVEYAWRHILSQTHRRGELFTIQLHPERIARCTNGLSATLAEARTLTPPVWLARLDQVAAWWRDRTAARVDVRKADDSAFHLSVKGPPGTTILVRGVKVNEPTEPWIDRYLWVKDTHAITVYCDHLPFIGVSPGSPPALVSFLRQQGYIVQVSADERPYALYLDRTGFTGVDELALLTDIEKNDFPLVRLGRWPYGARSALVVTGDIDALTIWDYALRFFGK